MLAGVATGDAEAAAQLVRRYQARIVGLAMTVVGDRATAEDVAQEVFLRVWRHAAAYDVRRGSVRSWMLTITRNLSIDVLRMRRQIPVDPSDAARLAITIGVGPDELAGDPVELQRVRGAVRSLSIEQQRAVLLAVFRGLTAGEIAALERVPLGTAKSRVRLGLARLRTILGAVE